MDMTPSSSLWMWRSMCCELKWTVLYLWCLLLYLAVVASGGKGRILFDWRLPALGVAAASGVPPPPPPPPPVKWPLQQPPQTKTPPPRVLVKAYSGLRHRHDTIRMIYYHDQTVAVVELQENHLLIACELIEIYQPQDIPNILLQINETISKPLEITFSQMVTLMGQCDQVESNRSEATTTAAQFNGGNRGLFTNGPFVLFSGIIPGTKWCGTGDVATNYHDLGGEHDVDRCCRRHDLCPVKIRAYSQRYRLNNTSLYTKSHCKCDDHLYACLKNQSSSPTALIMGNIFFNLVQVPCIETIDQTGQQWRFRGAHNNF